VNFLVICFSHEFLLLVLSDFLRYFAICFEILRYVWVAFHRPKQQRQSYSFYIIRRKKILKKMKKNEIIIDSAVQIVENEANAIMGLREKIGDDFQKTVDLILESKGNLVFSGIGKSAIIAQKVVATLNSTGTPAVFMHAADAIHGDLGIIRNDDIVVILSKSGETPEIKMLVPLIKLRGNKIVAIVGNRKSYLASQADLILDVTVPEEAIPGSLAPTSSTTAQLVMGDALALILMRCRGFSTDDFAKFHPGGALGKQLYLRVKDLYTRNERPEVGPNDNLTQVIIEMTSKRLGATVVTENEKIMGIITDGDLRRMLMKYPDIEQVKAAQIMTSNPKTIDEEALVVDALHKMRENSITQLPVVHEGKYLGIIHLHDILKEGIF
jgi:arabinose-5-phosphate isomerase